MASQLACAALQASTTHTHSTGTPRCSGMHTHTFTHTQTPLLHSSSMSHPSPQWDPMEQWMAHTAPSSKAVGTLSFKLKRDPQTAAGVLVKCVVRKALCGRRVVSWSGFGLQFRRWGTLSGLAGVGQTWITAIWWSMTGGCRKVVWGVKCTVEDDYTFHYSMCFFSLYLCLKVK